MSNEKEIRDARFPREESRIQATLAFLVGRAVTRAPYTRRLQPASFTADPYRSEMFVESIDQSIDVPPWNWNGTRRRIVIVIWTSVQE